MRDSENIVGTEWKKNEHTHERQLKPCRSLRTLCVQFFAVTER